GGTWPFALERVPDGPWRVTGQSHGVALIQRSTTCSAGTPRKEHAPGSSVRVTGSEARWDRFTRGIRKPASCNRVHEVAACDPAPARDARGAIEVPRRAVPKGEHVPGGPFEQGSTRCGDQAVMALRADRPHGLVAKAFGLHGGLQAGVLRGDAVAGSRDGGEG